MNQTNRHLKGLDLDLLAYQNNLKIKTKDNQRYLLDPVRKAYYKLLPEELVRQCWIQFLMLKLNISLGAISVEKQIDLGKDAKRSDMVVYQKGMPFMLFEFKSFKVKISERTCRQVAVYNMKLKVPYIIISNGIKHYAYHIDFENKQVDPLDTLPDLATNH